MHHIICCAIFGFFIILGVLDIAVFVVSKLLECKTSKPRTIFIPIKGHVENIEFITRKIVFKLEFFHPFSNFNIIFIDCGIDSETKFICRTLCEIYSKKVSLIERKN